MSNLSASNLPVDIVALIADNLVADKVPDAAVRRMLTLNRHYRMALSDTTSYTKDRKFKVRDEDDVEILNTFLVTCSLKCKRIDILRIEVWSADLFHRLQFDGCLVSQLDIFLKPGEDFDILLPAGLTIDKCLALQTKYAVAADETQCLDESWESDMYGMMGNLEEMVLSDNQESHYSVVINSSIHNLNTFVTEGVLPILARDQRFVELEMLHLEGKRDIITTGLDCFVPRSPNFNDLTIHYNTRGEKVEEVFELPEMLNLKTLDVKNCIIDMRNTPVPPVEYLYLTDSTIMIDQASKLLESLVFVKFKLYSITSYDRYKPVVTDVRTLVRMRNVTEMYLEYRSDISLFTAFCSSYFDGHLHNVNILHLMESRYLRRNLIDIFAMLHPTTTIYYSGDFTE